MNALPSVYSSEETKPLVSVLERVEVGCRTFHSTQVRQEGVTSARVVQSTPAQAAANDPSVFLFCLQANVLPRLCLLNRKAKGAETEPSALPRGPDPALHLRK
jgi:hypothetical protein